MPFMEWAFTVWSESETEKDARMEKAYLFVRDPDGKIHKMEIRVDYQPDFYAEERLEEETDS
jgi:hypothetical protein